MQSSARERDHLLHQQRPRDRDTEWRADRSQNPATDQGGAESDRTGTSMGAGGRRAGQAAGSPPLLSQKEAWTVRTLLWDWWPQRWNYIPFPGKVTKAVVAASGAQKQGAAGLVLSAQQTQPGLLSGLVLRHDSVMALAWAPPKSRSPSVSGIQ